MTTRSNPVLSMMRIKTQRTTGKQRIRRNTGRISMAGNYTHHSTKARAQWLWCPCTAVAVRHSIQEGDIQQDVDPVARHQETIAIVVVAATVVVVMGEAAVMVEVAAVVAVVAVAAVVAVVVINLSGRDRQYWCQPENNCFFQACMSVWTIYQYRGKDRMLCVDFDDELFTFRRLCMSEHLYCLLLLKLVFHKHSSEHFTTSRLRYKSEFEEICRVFLVHIERVMSSLYL